MSILGGRLDVMVAAHYEAVIPVDRSISRTGTMGDM